MQHNFTDDFGFNKSDDMLPDKRAMAKQQREQGDSM
jgi:hypothetical protein